MIGFFFVFFIFAVYIDLVGFVQRRLRWFPRYQGWLTLFHRQNSLWKSWPNNKEHHGTHREARAQEKENLCFLSWIVCAYSGEENWDTVVIPQPSLLGACYSSNLALPLTSYMTSGKPLNFGRYSFSKRMIILPSEQTTVRLEVRKAFWLQ